MQIVGLCYAFDRESNQASVKGYPHMFFCFFVFVFLIAKHVIVGRLIISSMHPSIIPSHVDNDENVHS